jgi:hypothetical protein
MDFASANSLASAAFALMLLLLPVDEDGTTIANVAADKLMRFLRLLLLFAAMVSKFFSFLSSSSKSSSSPTNDAFVVIFIAREEEEEVKEEEDRERRVEEDDFNDFNDDDDGVEKRRPERGEADAGVIIALILFLFTFYVLLSFSLMRKITNEERKRVSSRHRVKSAFKTTIVTHTFF